MTQEEKQLLLKDLCARLPHGIMVNFTLGDIRFDDIASSVDVNGSNVQVYTKHGFLRCPLEGDPEIELSQVKPYLRPMSSMTPQEWCELCDCNVEDEKAAIFIKDGRRFVSHVNQEAFLNSHHFDYRGLIPMGLALEAKEGMYKM